MHKSALHNVKTFTQANALFHRAPLRNKVPELGVRFGNSGLYMFKTDITDPTSTVELCTCYPKWEQTKTPPYSWVSRPGTFEERTTVVHFWPDKVLVFQRQIWVLRQMFGVESVPTSSVARMRGFSITQNGDYKGMFEFPLEFDSTGKFIKGASPHIRHVDREKNLELSRAIRRARNLYRPRLKLGAFENFDMTKATSSGRANSENVWEAITRVNPDDIESFYPLHNLCRGIKGFEEHVRRLRETWKRSLKAVVYKPDE